MFFQYVEQLCEQLFNLFITVREICGINRNQLVDERATYYLATVFFLLFYALNHSRYAAFVK